MKSKWNFLEEFPMEKCRSSAIREEYLILVAEWTLYAPSFSEVLYCVDGEAILKGYLLSSLKADGVIIVSRFRISRLINMIRSSRLWRAIQRLLQMDKHVASDVRANRLHLFWGNIKIFRRRDNQ